MAVKTNFSPDGKNSYFKVSAKVGTSPDGSPIRKVFYGKSKKEAEGKRDEYLTNIKKGLAVNYEKATFGSAFKSWFEDIYRPSVSVSTFARFELEYNKRIANSGLVSMPLVEVRTANLQVYFNGLLEKHTASTVHTTHKIIRKFFRYAAETDIVVKNYISGVVLPTLDDKIEETNAPLCDKDIEKLVKAAKENDKNFIFLFACFSGLRIGEILALRHGDIDFEGGFIHVRRTVKFLTIADKYQPIYTTPKTKCSKRDVPILDDIRKLLKRHIAREMEKHLRLGIPFDKKENLLFSSDVCTVREAPNVLRQFKRLAHRLDIEQDTLHSLRHTFCTICAKLGIPLHVVSEYMGHSDIGVTAKIYTKVSGEEKRNHIQRLGAYFR